LFIKARKLAAIVFYPVKSSLAQRHCASGPDMVAPDSVYDAFDLFSAAAARQDLERIIIDFLVSSREIAPRTLPSRLELNNPEGLSSAAPLSNVSLTALYMSSPSQIIPSGTRLERLATSRSRREAPASSARGDGFISARRRESV
jgi:hypothetical protein